MAEEWMCEHCGKVKDLKGDHLKGKTVVRSDCWPCAKKRTFVKGGGGPAAQQTTQQAAAIRNLTAAARAATASAASATTPAAPVPVFPSPFSRPPTTTTTTSFTRATLSPPNPFISPAISAASINKFQTSYVNAVAARHEDPAASPTSTSCSTASCASPWVMEAAAAGTSPPFTFRPNANYTPPRGRSVSGSGNTVTAAAAASLFTQNAALPSSTATVSNAVGAAATATAAATSWLAPAKDGGAAALATAPSEALQWMCEHCEKVKDLKGDHLKGKTVVRSDCWPCAKKRTFHLTSHAALAAARRPHTAHTAGLAAAASPSTLSGAPTLEVNAVAPPAARRPTTPPPKTAATATAAAAQTRLWRTPVVPSSTVQEDVYLLGSAAAAAPPTTTSFSPCNPHVAGAVDELDQPAVMARFGQQLLKTYRDRLVRGVPPRAVWYDGVLYVVTGETAPSEAGGDLVELFAELGRRAALYLAVEQKLAGSRFRRVGRLFCPDELSFAAACCYANNFFSAVDGGAHPHQQQQQSSSSPSSSPSTLPPACDFRVYGPQSDPTKALSLWGRIIGQCPAARPCVVSEEQRVAAAQTLYRRVSWLAAPHAMTGTAIQLAMEDGERGGGGGRHGGAEDTDAHALDVVLVTETMRLEDLPQAVALAQRGQSFTAS